MKIICCYIGDDHVECDIKAEFEITPMHDHSEHSFTHACEKHVGSLLGTNREDVDTESLEYHVSPIQQD